VSTAGAINTKVATTKGMTTALGSKNSLVSTNAEFGDHKHNLLHNQFSLKSIFSKNAKGITTKGSKKE
jgi:hypothetical protein